MNPAFIIAKLSLFVKLFINRFRTFFFGNKVLNTFSVIALSLLIAAIFFISRSNNCICSITNTYHCPDALESSMVNEHLSLVITSFNWKNLNQDFEIQEIKFDHISNGSHFEHFTFIEPTNFDYFWHQALFRNLKKWIEI